MSAYARGLLGAGALGMAVTWNVTNAGALPDTLALAYGVGLASIALLTSVMFLAELLLSLPAGRLIDRTGPRRVGLASLVVVALGNAALAAIDVFGVALVLRFIVGAAAGAGFLAGAAYVGRLGGTAFTQGMYGSAVTVASGFALMIVPALEDALDWRAPFISAAAIAVLALGPLAAGPETPLSGTHEERLPLTRLMADHRVLRFGAVQGAAFGLGVVLSAWTVTILGRRGGIDSKQAGVVAALIFLVGIVGRPIGGYTLRNHPALARPLFVSGMLCGALGTILLVVAEPLTLALCGAALVGLATGLPFGATLSVLAREFPAAVGSAFGAVNMYALGAIVIVTPIVGTTFSDGGSGAAGFGFVALLWVLAAFAVPGRDLLVGDVIPRK